MRGSILAAAMTGWFVVGCAAAATPDRLIFTKSFPQSQPPWVRVTIESSGAGRFQTSPNDDDPVTFQLSAGENAEIRALAQKVDLSTALESPLKVANMGRKTLRFEGGGSAAEQTFNWTQNEDARALADWFERISESEQRYLDLERTAKYEKIGVNEALLGIQADWEQKRLAAPKQFLPLLDRIAKGDSYVRMARNRAASLADAFRATP